MHGSCDVFCTRVRSTGLVVFFWRWKRRRKWFWQLEGFLGGSGQESDAAKAVRYFVVRRKIGARGSIRNSRNGNKNRERAPWDWAGAGLWEWANAC